MIENTKIKKFALRVEYNGSYYHGWQNQKSDILSIQKIVEKAISNVANHKVSVICSGRTDAKVHSIGQIIHFTTVSVRRDISWILGINSYLPSDIAVQWIGRVSNKFHARYSAVSRCYRYIIYNSNYRSPFLHNYANHIYNKLDVYAMYQASQYLIGEYDFSSFRSSTCQSYTAYRKIIYTNVFSFKNFIFIDIQANSFLQYMVRNIVGCLIEVGKMHKRSYWMQYVLKKRNRKFCSFTAKPNGLYLLSVKYPKIFNVPCNI
ncbi:tRNA pseudouridine(38-40) synthase TruA [Buchnera aphidicola]|uniref:tRNA pseudouridine(38-40) synthase TruA n=1 Tax=Buchnera aphidicola TaxID=9 RepID=UPI0031B8B020